MKVTEVRKIAKNMRINIKNKDGELRTKESLLRSINKKIVKGGEVNSMNNEAKLKLKCEKYAELYHLGPVDELKVSNYSDLYRILCIYSREYEYYYELLYKLWDQEQINDYVKGRLDSLLSEYQATSVTERENMIKTYSKKIWYMFYLQAYYRIKKTGSRIIKYHNSNTNSKISSLNNNNKTKLVSEILDVQKMSNQDIKSEYDKLKTDPLMAYVDDLHIEAFTRAGIIEKYINELQPIERITNFRELALSNRQTTPKWVSY